MRDKPKHLFDDFTFYHLHEIEMPGLYTLSDEQKEQLQIMKDLKTALDNGEIVISTNLKWLLVKKDGLYCRIDMPAESHGIKSAETTDEWDWFESALLPSGQQWRFLAIK